MAKKVDGETKLAILKAVIITRLKEEPIFLSEIGSRIKALAVELDVAPKILGQVLVPLYKKAVNEALSPKALKKSAKRGHHHHHH